MAKIITCSRCGRQIEAKSAKKKYCTQCLWWRDREKKRCRALGIPFVEEKNTTRSFTTREVMDSAKEAREKGTTYGKLNAPKVEVEIPEWAKCSRR